MFVAELFGSKDSLGVEEPINNTETIRMGTEKLRRALNNPNVPPHIKQKIENYLARHLNQSDSLEFSECVASIANVKEDYKPTHYGKTYGDPGYKRFAQLGIADAYDLFIDWVEGGVFADSGNLSQQLDRYEQMFHLVRSVLPPEVTNSYKNIKLLFRGFRVPDGVVEQALKHGINIASRIESWAPIKTAIWYYSDYAPSLLLKHKPTPDEIIISLNPATLRFLGVPRDRIVNPGETILTRHKFRIDPNEIVPPDIADELKNKSGS